MTDQQDYEVIIIGGSYAGLSAAMALGRTLRSVLIIDSGMPCNRQTPHSHNFITQDGVPPAEIAAKAREQVLRYTTVHILNDSAISGAKTAKGFTITTGNNQSYTAKKLIFATGIKDIFPDIKGMEACWGISVIHCPYCHGYEARNQETAIMANGEKAFHLASLVRNLTDRLTVITSGKADFNETQLAKLQQHNIRIIEEEVTEIMHYKGYVSGLSFKNGSGAAFTAVYAAIPFVQHTDIPISLGCELTEHGYIKTDPFQKTSIEGIYACGDNSAMMRSVANAVYTGNLAGAMVNKELTNALF